MLHNSPNNYETVNNSIVNGEMVIFISLPWNAELSGAKHPLKRNVGQSYFICSGQNGLPAPPQSFLMEAGK